MTATAAPDYRKASARSLAPGLRIWLPLLVVVALVGFFGIASDAFLTPRNFTAIAAQAGTLLIACLGATFVVLMGSIDLSVGAVALLAGAVSVLVLNGYPIGAGAMLVGLGLGALLGLVNGAVFALGRIPSFVVTLGTLSLFSGLALRLLDGRAISYSSPSFEWIAIGQLVPRLPNIALVAILLWAVLSFIGSRTRFGRYIFTIGAGKAVATIAGLPVGRYKVYAFVVAGAFAAARLGAAGPTLGGDLLLNTLGAIVIGGTSLAGGIGGVHRTLVGVLIIAILDNGLNLLGVDAYTQMVVKGLVIVAAVLVSRGGQGLAIVK